MHFHSLPLNRALSALALAALPFTAAAAPAPFDLSPTLKPILAKHKAPGIIAAILDANTITALGAAGIRKSDSPVPITSADQIHLGSDTKAMTALLIGQLIENKQLTFDTPMDKIFPDLASKMKPAAAKITVQHLLNHTSGLPANAPDWWAYDRSNDPLPTQRRDAVKFLLAADPAQPPGTKYLYSNAGYVILGAILEQKTGRTWEQLIQQKIFAPLKMTSAGFGPPGTSGLVDEPWGHLLDNDKLKPSQTDNPPVMNSAGRVHCTISDWAKFIALYLQPHAGVPALLNADIQKQLITPAKGMVYAGGWIITERPWAGPGTATVLTHSGSNTMWYCVAWLAPKKDFAVLSAVNLGGDDAASACDDAAAAMIQLHEKPGGLTH
jgi:CubicO group peptidase (beta-lactamase class C family)